jgi:hypothetical protein
VSPHDVKRRENYAIERPGCLHQFPVPRTPFMFFNLSRRELTVTCSPWLDCTALINRTRCGQTYPWTRWWNQTRTRSSHVTSTSSESLLIYLGTSIQYMMICISCFPCHQCDDRPRHSPHSADKGVYTACCTRFLWERGTFSAPWYNEISVKIMKKWKWLILAITPVRFLKKFILPFIKLTLLMVLRKG